MPTYTVKAPDGKTVTLQGPEGASEADIIAQAQRLYTPPPPAQMDTWTTKVGSRTVHFQAPAGASKAEIHAAARAAGVNDAERRALVDGSRPSPPPPPPSSAPPLPKTTAGGAAWRGLQDGVPFANYIQAAGTYAGRALGLNDTDQGMSYTDMVRATKQQRDTLEEADRQQHPIAHYTGEAGGLVLGGGAIGAGTKAVAGIRAVAPIVNILQKSRLARIGAASAGGAGVGAVYGAGDAAPENAGAAAKSGAIVGAVAAPIASVAVNRVIVPLGSRALQVLSAPFSDFMKLPNASRVLGRITNSTTDDMRRQYQNFRAANPNANPTLFELLPLADRNKIMSRVVSKSDNVAEQAGTAIKDRAGNLGQEMRARVNQVLQPNRQAIQQDLMDDIVTARGGTPHPNDPDLVARAMESPTDMAEFRDHEARAIMAPHDASPVASTFDEILPQVPHNNNGSITMQDGDPAVTAAIRSAVPGGFRAPNQGVSAGDISDMIQSLRGDLGKGGIEGRTAQRAIDHLEGVLQDRAPNAAAAHQQMTDTYAARSRMMEGMQEGAATRLRDDVQIGTSRRQARTIRNAYDTPEGDAGRRLGQGNRLTTDLGGSPAKALSTTVDMATNDVGRELRQNLGLRPATQISEAAQAQSRSAQALGSAASKISDGAGENNNPAQALIQIAAALHPTSFASTKVGAIQKLTNLMGMPENRARTMVDMLFSQDPAMTQRAINALGNNIDPFMKYVTGAAGIASGGAAEGTVPDAAPAEPEQPDPAAPPADPNVPPPADPAALPIDPASSPYAPHLQVLSDTENPDLLALAERMMRQESRGHQFGPDGQPITSKKGAIGIMQVMPDTGPEAAGHAGLPWDETAYRADPIYNKLIGIGYLSHLLRKYNGDPAKATAAYNGGPRRVDDALRSGNNWLSRLPAETQDYVQKVL